MIFRKYRTIIIFLIIVGLTGALFKVLPSLKSLPRLAGVSQGSGANYPLPSADRILINLNGSWQNYGSLGSVVRNQVYGVKEAVYGGLVNPGAGVSVPGGWDDPVAVGSFYLDNNVSGRNFRLHVLGLGGKAQVYLNGFNQAYYVGDLGDTNTPQVIDIPSPRLKFGEVNSIAFKMDKPSPNGPWLVWPGVTGEVYLEAMGPIMLTEPKISVKLIGPNAELEYGIGLSTKDAGDLNGQINLFDSSGNLIATNTHVLKADIKDLNLSGKLSVPNPRQWSGSDPYLYRLEVVVTGARGARDSYVLPIGLREIQFAEGGLMLNKQRLEPKFLIRVAEPPGAERYSRLEADIKWAKSKGYNILYLPDGPPHPYLLDLADKYGLLVMGQSQFTGSVSQNIRPHQAGNVIRSLGYHPSFLAQGLGAGLDIKNRAANEYIRAESVPGQTFYTTLGNPNRLVLSGGGELELDGPYLADYVWNRLSLDGQDFMTNHTAQRGLLTRDRGEKEKEKAIPVGTVATLPKAIPLTAAALMLLLLMRSWGMDNLRFSQLNPEKPKRRFRNQVRQQSRWYLLRHGVLAAIFTDGAYSLSNNPVLEYLIDNFPGYKLQGALRYLLHNPIALGMLLFGMGLFWSLAMGWLRARTLPGKPGTVAMLLWLEKRKRWIVPVILAWNAVCFGLPPWLLWVALTLGFLVSCLTISNDIRRAGGKNYYMGFLVVGLVLLLILLGSGWDRVNYIYHWLRV